jgi:hypothetical protein
MFVAKNELKNAWKLSRVKYGNNKMWINYVCLMGFFFLSNLISVIVTIFSEKDSIDYNLITDVSLWSLAGFFIGFIIVNATYRTTNQYYAVYPQTNNSRFLSYVLRLHFLIAAVPLSLLAIYLLQYGILLIITADMSNIHFIYTFDVLFLIAGFAVMMIYCAVLTGIVTLIAVILRKFKIYAAVFFSVILVLAILNPVKAFDGFKAVFGFLIFEGGVWLFILKGVIFWAALLFVSFIINKYTVYYKTNNSILERKGITAAVFVCILIAGIALSITITRLSMPQTGGSYEVHENNTYDNWHEFPTAQFKEIRVDISHLTKGSEIEIKTGGDVTLVANEDKITGYGNYGNAQFIYYEDGSSLEYPREHMTIMINDELKNIQGDTLIIGYTLPFKVVLVKEIGHLTNPELNARLEGNTLYIDYSYEKNVKAVFVPIWTFMWQFDYFKGRDLYEPFYSYYSENNANIHFRIE